MKRDIILPGLAFLFIFSLVLGADEGQTPNTDEKPVYTGDPFMDALHAKPGWIKIEGSRRGEAFVAYFKSRYDDKSKECLLEQFGQDNTLATITHRRISGRYRVISEKTKNEKGNVLRELACEYDDRGNLLKVENKSFDQKTGKSMSSVKTYKYDDKNRLLLESMTDKGSLGEDIFCDRTYKYNDDGKKYIISNSNPKNPEEYKNDKPEEVALTFDKEGRILEKESVTEHNYEEVIEKTVVKEVFEYLENGQLKKRKTTRTTTSDDFKDVTGSRRECVYDDNGRLSKTLYYRDLEENAEVYESHEFFYGEKPQDFPKE